MEVSVRFNLMILPSWSQETPYHLVQKLVLMFVLMTHEDSFDELVWFLKVDFHLRRAFASEIVAETAIELPKIMVMMKIK